VQNPNVADYKKFNRTKIYRRETKESRITLQADNLTRINWWVDASFAVHPNLQSHMGVAVSFGGWDIYGFSTNII